MNNKNSNKQEVILQQKMLKTQQNQPESSLMRLVDNLDLKKEIQDQEYILLIKKQPGKDYSTLYMTDCEDNFWLKKIDLLFLQQLKEELKLKTNTETFISCLMKSIKDNCRILVNEQKLQLKLEIGQGLTMTCQIKLSTKLNRLVDQKGYKIILKLFLRQLYESKDSKERSIRKEIQELKKKKEKQEKVEVVKKDSKFINQVFNFSPEKKDPNKSFKNRDLMNPNRNKRKHAGIKLNTHN